MQIKPYYIVPLLVEQPTWGGSYLAKMKGIDQPTVNSKKIGQIYELAAETVLTETADTSFFFASAESISDTKRFGASETTSLKKLIDQSPENVLGSECVQRHGAKMPLLIKFTQAKSNSYQLHVKPDEVFDDWRPKPESWYFLKPGKATLGIKDINAADAYKARCLEIYEYAQKISDQIQNNKITLQEGRARLQSFIDQDHPENYVNVIFPDAGAVIDLSSGGVHHSWESDDSLPDGNIVYEVQRDVKDDVSTLRSFDQGKIKDDGSIRKLTIEEYFQALDTTPAANDPQSYLQQSETITEDGAEVEILFSNPEYRLTSISLKRQYSGRYTTTDSFHHLFVEKGETTIKFDREKYAVKEGWSLFIPAQTGKYQLNSIEGSKVLITSI